jgi:hypothetical protein
MDPRYSTSSGGFAPQYVSDFYSTRTGQLSRRGGMGALYLFLVVMIIALAASLVIWLIWYRPIGVTLGGFILLVIKSIFDIVLWPFKFILQALGIWTG